MSTWDEMSDADYAACVDAGRGPGPDPREVADLARKERQEGGMNSVQACIARGTHLVSCDADGYCNACGHQFDPEGITDD